MSSTFSCSKLTTLTTVVVLLSSIFYQQVNGVQNRPIVVPVQELRNARQEFGASHSFVQEFPPWVNLTLLEIGQKYFANNMLGFFYSNAIGSFMSGTNTDVLRIVISSGNMTERPKAMKRHLITMLHYLYWSNSNLQKSVEKENVFDTLNLIHSVHAKFAHSAVRHKNIYSKRLIPEPLHGENPYKLDLKLWDAFEKDLKASPLRKFQNRPIFPPKTGGTDIYFNQFTMASFLWGTVHLPVTVPKNVYFYGATDENLWAYIHYLAFIGHGLGIQDKYNVCLQPDLNSAKIYFRQMLEEYFIPGLFQLDYEYKVVIEVAIKSMADILPVIDFSEILYRLCRDGLQIDCPNVRRRMTAKARVQLSLLTTVAKPLLQYDLYQSMGRFIVRGQIQLPTIKHFKFNLLFRDNFTNGLIALDEEILRTSDVHFV